MNTHKWRGLRAAAGTRTRNQLLAELEGEPQAQDDSSVEIDPRNAGLRRRHNVLFENVAQQDDVMFYAAKTVGLLQAAGHLEGKEASVEATAAALISDLHAAELLQLICNKTSEDVQQLYTTQLMQAAFDAQRVLEVQQLSLQDLVAKFRSMTFRLSFLLNMPESRASLLRGSLGGATDEYGELDQLCYIAVPDLLWELCRLNMESMQPQAPPPEHWEAVSTAMELQPEQIQQLAMGFEVYSKQRAAIVKGVEACMQQVHKILWPAAHEAQAYPAVAAAAAAVEAAVEAACGSSSSSGDGGPLQDWQSWDLGTLEQTMQLMRDIDQKVQQLKTLECHLSHSWINLMTKRQLAVAVVESYPYHCLALPLFEVAAKMAGRQKETASLASECTSAGSNAPSAALAVEAQPMDTPTSGQAMQ